MNKLNIGKVRTQLAEKAGTREKRIMNTRGARVKKIEPGVYDVCSKSGCFTITYGHKSQPNFKIVG